MKFNGIVSFIRTMSRSSLVTGEGRENGHGPAAREACAGTSQGREHFAAGCCFASCRELGRSFSRVFREPAPGALRLQHQANTSPIRLCRAGVAARWRVAARGPTVVYTPQFDPKDLRRACRPSIRRMARSPHSREGHNFPYRHGLALLLDPELHSIAAQLRPQLFLDSSSIEATARKLKALIGSKDPGDRLYGELFVHRAPARIVPARMWDSRRSPAEGRLGAVAGEARSGLYRGEPCGPRLARVAGAARRLEHIPFRPCLHAAPFVSRRTGTTSRAASRAPRRCSRRVGTR